HAPSSMPRSRCKDPTQITFRRNRQVRLFTSTHLNMVQVNRRRCIAAILFGVAIPVYSLPSIITNDGNRPRICTRDEVAVENGESLFGGGPGIGNNFDYIIIGGGASGCTIANRLTENRSISVLLIEAGPL